MNNKKDCPICHGKGYETVIKPRNLWKRPPIPESEERFCVCRLITGLTKKQVKRN